MPPAIKVIFSDIDGTLLDGSRLLSARTSHAISAVRSSGSWFALATGRMPGGLEAIFDTLGYRLPAVCLSGSLVLDECGDTVFSHCLDGDVTRRILDLASSEFPEHPVSYFAGTDWFCDDPGKPIIEREVSVVRAAPTKQCLYDVLGSGLLPNKLYFSFFNGDPTSALLAESLRQTFRDITVIRSSTGSMIEIIPKGVNKWSGAKRLVDYLGIDARDTLAFGDDLNDLPLLTGAGVGVAVANASADVLEAADDVCPAGVDDGVARYLESHFRKDQR